MLKTLKKFFAFCGVDNRRLFITSIWLGVVSAICSAMRIPDRKSTRLNSSHLSQSRMPSSA